MKIKIYDEELELRYTARADMKFENMTGHSFNFDTDKPNNELLKYYYCLLMGANPSSRLLFDYEDGKEYSDKDRFFIDWIDEDYMNHINIFIDFLMNHLKKMQEFATKPNKEYIPDDEEKESSRKN